MTTETTGQAPAAPYDTDSAAEALLERFQRPEKEPEPESAEEAPAAEAPDEGQAEEAEVAEETPQEDEVEEELEWEGKSFKVKGVSPQELKNALLRQQDYTRKTMEVAEQRKAFDASRQAQEASLKLREQTLEQRAELHALQGAYNSIVQNLGTLARDNPVEAVNQQATLKQLEFRAAQIQSEIQQKEQYISATQSRQQAEAKQRGLEILQREIPGWGTRETLEKIIGTAKTLGVSDNFLAEVMEPGVIKALHKARLYDELQANKAKVIKKVSEAPKTLKPGTGNQTTPGKVRTDEADARLRKSGRLDDAANAILARIVKGK